MCPATGLKDANRKARLTQPAVKMPGTGSTRLPAIGEIRPILGRLFCDWT